jgi:hypothetical protein
MPRLQAIQQASLSQELYPAPDAPRVGSARVFDWQHSRDSEPCGYGHRGCDGLDLAGLRARDCGEHASTHRTGCNRGARDGQFLLAKSLLFFWEEFKEHPDKAGYLLVRSIYQAFHLTEDRIPPDYDRVQERLVLQD